MSELCLHTVAVETMSQATEISAKRRVQPQQKFGALTSTSYSIQRPGDAIVFISQNLPASYSIRHPRGSRNLRLLKPNNILNPTSGGTSSLSLASQKVIMPIPSLRPFAFTGLPLELGIKIYQYIFDGSAFKVVLTRRGARTTTEEWQLPKDISFLQTSSQIYAEVLPLLRSKSVLDLGFSISV